VAEDLRCTICGEAADERDSSVCNSCGERFHLNQRNDRPGKDCGTVWIDDRYLALEYACQRCLDGETPPAPPLKPRLLRPRVGPRRYRKRE
jgi:hypothetical protein